MRRALLDTSFVIAIARADQVVLEESPEEAAISAVTLGGLHHGVLAATDAQRPGRLATLAFAERRFAVLPVDSRVAPHYGRLLASSGEPRGRKLRTTDVLVAATAAAHGLPVITRDRDFEDLEGVESIVV